jgi:hypothetical protein
VKEAKEPPFIAAGMTGVLTTDTPPELNRATGLTFDAAAWPIFETFIITVIKPLVPTETGDAVSVPVRFAPLCMVITLLALIADLAGASELWSVPAALLLKDIVPVPAAL